MFFYCTTFAVMVKNLIILSVCSVTLMFSSCETDFDVVADWKEITVVYGLLNPVDSVHYIRVNKAFLGEGDAMTMASVADSVNFQEDLEVTLQRSRKGTLLSSHTLIKDTSVPKDPGLFAYPGQTLYRTQPGVKVFTDSDYVLNIKNTKSGNMISSVTPVVDSISVISPLSSEFFAVSFTEPNPFPVKWVSAKDGRLYNVVIRFNYREVKKNDPSQIENKSLVWNFPNKKSPTLAGSENMEILIEGSEFFKFLGQSISVDPSVDRLSGRLDFLFTIGADALDTYIEANKPALGLVQEKPQFSNVTGGIGLFSSRITQGVLNKRLTTATIDEIACGLFTRHLGFKRNDLTPCN
jgi:hypothetical protein